jgi:histidinol-phosphate phosphatase family protein
VAVTRKAIFVDKDGALVENVPYNVDPSLIRLTGGAGAALARLQAAGYALVVVSNQSGVARGYFHEDALRHVRAEVQRQLDAHGVELAAFYWCPHLPSAPLARYRETCDCRKPAPGMLLQAARDLSLDLAGSWLIGDILDDIEAGSRAGCRTILLDVGSETEWIDGPHRRPTAHSTSLGYAADLILAADAPSLAGHEVLA